MESCLPPISRVKAIVPFLIFALPKVLKEDLLKMTLHLIEYLFPKPIYHHTQFPVLSALRPLLFNYAFFKVAHLLPVEIFKNNMRHFRQIIWRCPSLSLVKWLLSLGCEFDAKFKRKLNKMCGDVNPLRKQCFRAIRSLVSLK